MTVFLPGVKNCYKCGKIGHTEKSLPLIGTFSCRDAKNIRDCSKKYAYCKGNHKAFNQNCPLIIKEREIKSVMTSRSGGFVEVRRTVER